MDGPIERLHMGLIDVMMCPYRGWCGEHNGDDTVLPCGLPRPISVVRLGILYLMVLLY